MESWKANRDGAWDKAPLGNLPGQPLYQQMAELHDRRCRKPQGRPEWLVFSPEEVAFLAGIYTPLFPTHGDVGKDAYRLLTIFMEHVAQSSDNAPSLTWVYAHDVNAIDGPPEQRRLALWFSR